MVLVTGGLGFIGSHVVLSLLAHGHEVVIVDNLANSSLYTLERLEFISGMYIPFVKLDVRNTPALNKVFEQYSIEAVIHTAGFKSLEESRLKPLEYYNDNVSCIMSLLRAMQRTGNRTLVHLSSLAIYGQSSTELNEDTPFNYAYPNPYIKSQQMIEEIIRDTAKTDSEWKIAILRLGNVAGAYTGGILGEVVAPLPKNILPLMLQAAALQRDSIALYQHVETEDHTVERSFVHIMDVCEAIFQSLHWLANQSSTCESFNIAGERHSILQLLHQVEELTQSKITVEHMDAVDEQLAQIDSNSLKAAQMLHWQAKRQLRNMIEDEWLYYQQSLKNT